MKYVKYEVKIPKPIIDLLGAQNFRQEIEDGIISGPSLCHLHPELVAKILVTKPRKDGSGEDSSE